MKNKSKKFFKHKPYVALKRCLAGKGLKYADLAELLGVTELTIQYKINGQSDFYLSEQEKICSEYNLKRDIFFEDSVADTTTKVGRCS